MIPISKPLIGEEEVKNVISVLESGHLAQGPWVAELEECYSEICGTRHAIATTSGTTALHVALLSHGIGPGDEVVTTPFTFIASVNTILMTGATPVFADIRPDSFNIDPEAVSEAVTPRTKAIMPVHLYGQVCEMDALQEIADMHDLVIIEDACQAIGACYKDRPAGSFGTGVFSLYATKNVMSGEGGVMTTNDEGIAERARLLRNHGMARSYYHDMLGYNYRLSDLHAAIGVAQAKRLAQFSLVRQRHAHYVGERLIGVHRPVVLEGRNHVFHQFTVRVPDGKRDALAAHLHENEIGFGIYYPVPAHRQDYIGGEINGQPNMPEADRAAREVLSLPVHPALTLEDLDTIVDAVNDYYV